MVWAKKILHLGLNRGGHDPSVRAHLNGSLKRHLEKGIERCPERRSEKFLGRGSEGLRLKSD
jgi:hypothetical protein